MWTKCKEEKKLSNGFACLKNSSNTSSVGMFSVKAHKIYWHLHWIHAEHMQLADLLCINISLKCWDGWFNTIVSLYHS